MIAYSYINLEKPLEESALELLLKELPTDMKVQMGKYRCLKDRQLYLLGKILIKRLLHEFGYSSNSLSRLYKNQYGKLFIDDKVDFNISHSGNMVIVAISNTTKLGVDIEQKINYLIEDLIPLLRKDEVNELLSENSNETFFHFWTKKESVLKAKGLGFGMDLKDIYLYDNYAVIKEKYSSELWWFNNLALNENYVTNLCSQQNNQEIIYLPMQFGT